MSQGPRPSFAASFGVHAVLLTATLVALYPVLWVLSLAFSGAETVERRLLPLPVEPSLGNFAELFAQPHFFQQLVNSLIVALGTSVVAVAIASPAAYAMSRFDFLGRDAATKSLLATQMFPGVLAAVPLYLILSWLGLLDSLAGLALVYGTTAVPFAIFQLRAAFDAVPKELEEAALIDGATRFGAFWRVVLPSARPALAVTVLFAFMAAWNEFILAATFLSDESSMTIPVVLQRFVGEYEARWRIFAAGATVVSIPVMALFYAIQRHLVAGLGGGAVKG